VVGGFSLFIDDPVLEEIDLIGVSGTIEWDVIYPLVFVAFTFSIDEFKLPGLSHAGDFIDPFKQRLVVGGLCHEDIGHAVCLKGVDKGLLGIKVIAGDDDRKLGMRFSDFLNNSFASVRLAVLLGVPIGVLDGLREKRNNLTHIGMNNGGLKDLVMVARRPFGRLGLQAVGTVYFFGGKIFGAIKGDEVLSIQEPILVKLPAALETVQKVREDNAESNGRDHIDDIPHLSILGDADNAKDLGKIVLLRAFLQSFLKGKNGSVLEKHHGEAAHQDIVQAIIHFPILAGIMDLPETLSHGSF
jgi:hypothetical protein